MQIQLSGAVPRPWRLQDAADLQRSADNRNVSRDLLDHFPYPYSLDDAREWIGGQLEQAESAEAAATNLVLAIEVEGGAAGGIVLHRQSDVGRLSAELGYWLAEPHWGKGIASEAAAAVSTYGLEELSLQRVFALAFDRSVASQRALEKAGFQFEGRLRQAVLKDGEVMDELLYARVRNQR